MIDLINKLIESVASLVVVMLNLLPNSPFSFDYGPLGQYLGYINYFIPVPTLLSILGAYLVCFNPS